MQINELKCPEDKENINPKMFSLDFDFLTNEMSNESMVFIINKVEERMQIDVQRLSAVDLLNGW